MWRTVILPEKTCWFLCGCTCQVSTCDQDQRHPWDVSNMSMFRHKIGRTVYWEDHNFWNEWMGEQSWSIVLSPTTACHLSCNLIYMWEACCGTYVPHLHMSSCRSWYRNCLGLPHDISYNLYLAPLRCFKIINIETSPTYLMLALYYFPTLFCLKSCSL